MCMAVLLQAYANQSVYNRVDWFIRIYLERYVDLDKQQNNLLKVNLRTLKDWHKQQELSTYITFLDSYLECVVS